MVNVGMPYIECLGMLHHFGHNDIKSWTLETDLLCPIVGSMYGIFTYI